MKHSKTDLDCLLISKEILQSDHDCTTKVILAYIDFRLKHPSIEWTFSQADVCQALNIDRQKVYNKIKKLVAAGVLNQAGTKITASGKIKLYTVNADKFRAYLVTKQYIPLVTNQPDLVTKPAIPCNKTIHYKNDSRRMINKNDTKYNNEQKVMNPLNLTQKEIVSKVLNKSQSPLAAIAPNVKSEALPLFSLTEEERLNFKQQGKSDNQIRLIESQLMIESLKLQKAERIKKKSGGIDGYFGRD